MRDYGNINVLDYRHWTGYRSDDGFWWPPRKGALGGGLSERLLLIVYFLVHANTVICIILLLFLLIGGALFSAAEYVLGFSFPVPDRIKQSTSAGELWIWIMVLVATWGVAIFFVVGSTVHNAVMSRLESTLGKEAVPVGDIMASETLLLGLRVIRWTDVTPTGETRADTWDEYAQSALWTPVILGGIGGAVLVGAAGLVGGGIFGYFVGRALSWVVTAVRPRQRKTMGAIDEQAALTTMVDCSARVVASDEGELKLVIERLTHAHNRYGFRDRQYHEIPWNSFVNFEEGDYASWFHSATQPRAVQKDRAVIVQPRGGSRILVSHHADAHFAGELRSRLEREFVRTRDAALLRWEQEQASKYSPNAPTGIPGTL